MPFGKPSERNLEQLTFHAQNADELRPGNVMGPFGGQAVGFETVYHDYLCGTCGSKTTGRVLCDVKRKADGAMVRWCQCACEKREPAIIVEKDNGESMQLPQPKTFHADPAWPTELQSLFEEAAKSFTAGAYTASSMVCRKILMACACHEMAKAGQTPDETKNFVWYVDYIVNSVLTFPQARSSIDAIRGIGNDANHHVAFATLPEAERSMNIVRYMLNTIYSLPVI